MYQKMKTKGDMEKKLRDSIYGTVNPDTNKVDNGLLFRGVKVYDEFGRFTPNAMWLLGFRHAYAAFEEEGWPQGLCGLQVAPKRERRYDRDDRDEDE
jgi:hypothetical protein